MKLLGIDYGKSKIGLALLDTQTKLIVPLKVIRYQDLHKVFNDIKKIIDEEKVEKLVVGVSEGQIADDSKNFGRLLGRSCYLSVDFVDETLTSWEAQTLSIQAGIKRKKRKTLEDAYSASLILQEWLDTRK